MSQVYQCQSACAIIHNAYNYVLDRAEMDSVGQQHRGEPVFDFKRCSTPGCDATALSDETHCAAHCSDGEAYTERVLASLEGVDTVKNLNIAGLRFQATDFSGKKFYSCSFSRGMFKNVTFSGCVFRMCFFDFCDMDSCDFSGIDAQFCSFAGSRMLNGSFENSELIHNNFDGIRASSCTFNYSNLYNSRFIMAEFDKTDFIDCNMKKAFFVMTSEKDVSWKFSNVEEAIRDLERLDL